MRAQILCSAMFLAACGQVRAESVELRRSFELGPSPAIEIKNVSGPITVVAHDGSKVEVRALKQGSGEDLAQVEVRLQTHGGSLQVSTEYPEASGCRGHGHVSVAYELRVPRASRLQAKNVSGAVQASEVRGGITVETVSGSIEVQGSGAAELALKSVSGAIRVAASSGVLNAKSVSGKIEVTRLRDARQPASLRTVSGPVRIALDPRGAARVEVSTTSGKVTAELPLRLNEHERRWFRGELGQGGALIRASTVSGSVELAKLTTEP